MLLIVLYCLPSTLDMKLFWRQYSLWIKTINELLSIIQFTWTSWFSWVTIYYNLSLCLSPVLFYLWGSPGSWYIVLVKGHFSKFLLFFFYRYFHMLSLSLPHLYHCHCFMYGEGFLVSFMWLIAGATCILSSLASFILSKNCYYSHICLFIKTLACTLL